MPTLHLDPGAQQIRFDRNLNVHCGGNTPISRRAGKMVRSNRL
jgi:hypothetical protein